MLRRNTKLNDRQSFRIESERIGKSQTKFGNEWKLLPVQWRISARRPAFPPCGSAHAPKNADAIIVGAGLAGLVAAVELVEAGKHVTILEQEPSQSLGGQAFWSFGGLFLVDSPEQRRMRIRDSHDLAGRIGWNRGIRPGRGEWPRKWAEAYVAFAAGEKRSWLHEKGVRFFPVVGWAERGETELQGQGIRFRAFTSPGEPAQASSILLSASSSKPNPKGW